MLDNTDTAFAYSDSREDTGGLIVRFELYPLKDEKASAAAGRPVYNETEFIDIRIPGDRTLTIHRPVRESDKRRFAVAYRNWKAQGGGDAAASGTPLAQWPQVSRSQVEELAFFNVRTVEQLASVSDSNLKNIGPLLALRQKARDFLEAAKSGAPMAQMREELQAKGQELELLKAQMAELLAEKSKRKSKEA